MQQALKKKQTNKQTNKQTKKKSQAFKMCRCKTFNLKQASGLMGRGGGGMNPPYRSPSGSATVNGISA